MDNDEQEVQTTVDVTSVIFEQAETITGFPEAIDHGVTNVVSTIIEVITPGVQGPQGVPGSKASISTDPLNAIHLGSDGEMYVTEAQASEFTADLATIYALSK